MGTANVTDFPKTFYELLPAKIREFVKKLFGQMKKPEAQLYNKMYNSLTTDEKKLIIAMEQHMTANEENKILSTIDNMSYENVFKPLLEKLANMNTVQRLEFLKDFIKKQDVLLTQVDLNDEIKDKEVIGVELLKEQVNADK